MAAPEAAHHAPARVLRNGRDLAAALAAGELWLVIPALLAGLAVPRLLPASLAFAALFWPIRRVARGRFTVRTPGDRFIAVLILLLPVTLWVTPLPVATRAQVEWLLAGVAFYYAIVNWTVTPGRERAFVRVLIALGLLAALLAPVAVMWVTDIKLTFIPAAFYDALPLLAPVPMHPNVLAGALVLALPVPFALLLFGASDMPRGRRFATLAAALGIAAILVLTKSRGAWLAAGASALLLIVLRWRRGWLGIPVAALGAGLLLWRIGPDRVYDALIANGAIVGGPGRMEIWTRAVYLIQDFPFTGIGMGAFREVTNRLYPYFLLGPNADVPHAHNLFLQVAVDLGIPGLAAWLGLLTVGVISAWRIHRWGHGARDSWSAGLGAGLLAAQLALVVHGLVDAAVWGAHSGIVVWLLWGVCAAAYNLRWGAPARRLTRA